MLHQESIKETARVIFENSRPEIADAVPGVFAGGFVQWLPPRVAASACCKATVDRDVAARPKARVGPRVYPSTRHAMLPAGVGWHCGL
jgi:hypothetical protein